MQIRADARIAVAVEVSRPESRIAVADLDVFRRITCQDPRDVETERAGIQAVQAHLPEGHTTVGFEVHVKHFGATPKGKKVTVRAELLEVDGRKLRFKVEAHDEDKKVGEGTHRRAVVAIQRKE